MKEYNINTYEEAVEVIKELGFLPFAPLIPHYPSLDSITPKRHWHTDTDLDPWLWRTKFPVDGVAIYGKFIKKKAIFISSELLPFVNVLLGSKLSLEERYHDGLVSREAVELFRLIREEEGIDTRLLRAKAGMKDKEKKKTFDQALLELQGMLEIVVSGTKMKTNELGEKNGWSSTSFETMQYWTNIHKVMALNIDVEEAKLALKNHFAKFCSPDTMIFFTKIFKF